MNTMNTGIATSHSRMASRAGQNRARVYVMAMATHMVKTIPPTA